MKKTILIAASALFLGASASFAQDTTRRSTQDTSSVQQRDQRQSDQAQRDQTGVRKDNDNDMSGWSRMQDRDIPASLRTTLNDSKYKGWENSGIYRSERGDRYRVRVGDANNATTYYFDRDGKPEKNKDPD
jgi:hypothetical protein